MTQTFSWAHVPLSSLNRLLHYKMARWPCGDAVSAARSAFSFPCAALYWFAEPETIGRSEIARIKASEIKGHLTTLPLEEGRSSHCAPYLCHYHTSTCEGSSARSLAGCRWHITDFVSRSWRWRSRDNRLYLPLLMVEKGGEATRKFETSWNRRSKPYDFLIMARIGKILVEAW